eukprot:3141635-Rhodomonas_salina.2
MSGTATAYLAPALISLCTRYAMSSTDTAYRLSVHAPHHARVPTPLWPKRRLQGTLLSTVWC